MSKSAVKPRNQKLVTPADDENETLVTDHGIDGLVLHHDFDGVNQTISGTLEIARPIAFEATFNTKEAWDDRLKVREVLISGAVYTDEQGGSAAGHIAMNANFKRLLKWVMASLNEQAQETAE